MIAATVVVACGRDQLGVFTPTGGHAFTNAATTKTCQLGDGLIRRRDSAAAASVHRDAGHISRAPTIPESAVWRDSPDAPSLNIVSNTTPVTEIFAPDADYVSTTTKLRSIDGTTLSDSSLTVTMDVFGRIATVPDCWAYWSSPPYSESAAPPDSVIVVESRLAPYVEVPVESLNLRLSSPLKSFGLEIESECGYGDCATIHAYAEYFNHDTLIASTTTSLPDSRGAARLVALRSTGKPFDRVQLRVMDNAGVKEVFAIARIRYALASRLNVSCTPNSVTRGEDVRCVMSRTNGGTLTEPSWRFENPQLDPGITFTYPEYGDVPDTVWAGPLAVGGTVRAYAKLDGVMDSASTALSVLPRPWRTTYPIGPHQPVRYLGQGSLNPIPPSVGSFGNAYMGLDLQILCRAPVCRRIDQGPNRKLKYYLTPPITHAEYDVAINVVALAPGSSWRMSLPVNRVGGRCSASDAASLPLQSLIEQHEGLDPDTHVNSHTRVFRDVVDSIGPRTMEAAVEGVLPGPRALIAMVDNLALSESKRIVDDTLPGTRNPLRIPCTIP